MRKLFTLLAVCVLMCAAVIPAAAASEKRPKTQSKSYAIDAKGFESDVELKVDNMVFLPSSSLIFAVGATYTAGYRFGNYLYFGGGVGVRSEMIIDDIQEHFGVMSFPVFAKLRYYILPLRVTPFLELAGGCLVRNYSVKESYAIGDFGSTAVGSSTYKYLSSPFAELKIGMSHRLEKRHFVRLNYGLGLSYMRHIYTVERFAASHTNRDNQLGVNIFFGVSF